MNQKTRIAKYLIVSALAISIIIPIIAGLLLTKQQQFSTVFFLDSVLIEEQSTYIPGTTAYQFNRYELEGKSALLGYDAKMETNTIYSLTMDSQEYVYYVAYYNVAYLVDSASYASSVIYLNQKSWPVVNMDNPPLLDYKLTTSTVASPSKTVTSVQVDLPLETYYGIPVNTTMMHVFNARCDNAASAIVAFPVIGSDELIEQIFDTSLVSDVYYGYQQGTSTYAYVILKVGDTWYRGNLVKVLPGKLLCVATDTILFDAKISLQERDDFKAVEVIDKFNGWSSIKTSINPWDSVSVNITGEMIRFSLVTVPDAIIESEIGQSLHRKSGEPKIFYTRDLISNGVLAIFNYGGRWYRTLSNQLVGVEFQSIIDGINQKQLVL